MNLGPGHLAALMTNLPPESAQPRGSWSGARPAGEPPDPALVEGLRGAVPEWRRVYRGFCTIEAGRRARICGTYVGAHGDNLQYIVTKGRSGRAAEAFNRLAEGLALLSAQPKGVVYAGLHFISAPLADPASGCTIQWCQKGGLCRTTRGGSW